MIQTVCLPSSCIKAIPLPDPYEPYTPGVGIAPTAPVPVSGAMADGDSSMVLTFDKPLDSGSVPAASAFQVVMNSVAKTPIGVQVSGSTVKLLLDGSYSGMSNVKVNYTPPGSNPLKGSNGLAVAGFSNFQAVP